MTSCIGPSVEEDHHISNRELQRQSSRVVSESEEDARNIIPYSHLLVRILELPLSLFRRQDDSDARRISRMTSPRLSSEEWFRGGAPHLERTSNDERMRAIADEALSILRGTNADNEEGSRSND